MTDINQVVLVGRVTADVTEVRYSQNGTAIANLSIACNESVKDAGGNFTDKASFFNITCFGKLAERIKGLSKGSKITIVGRLTQDRWEKDGQKRDRVYIKAECIDFPKVEKTENARSPEPSTTSASSEEFPDEVPF